MPEHLRPFQKFTPLDHGLEALRVDEMIVSSIDLAGPLLSRCHRHRQLDPWISLEQLARQRVLAGPRRRRQHEHEPAPADGIFLFPILLFGHSSLPIFALPPTLPPPPFAL